MAWTKENGCDVARGDFISGWRRVAIWTPGERNGKPGNTVEMFAEDPSGNRRDESRIWIAKHSPSGSI